jgi:hypothetical protein
MKIIQQIFIFRLKSEKTILINNGEFSRMLARFTKNAFSTVAKKMPVRRSMPGIHRSL